MKAATVFNRRKSIGPCAKKCKGRKKGAFRSCVKHCMR
jgi:hypothetical protein